MVEIKISEAVSESWKLSKSDLFVECEPYRVEIANQHLVEGIKSDEMERKSNLAKPTNKRYR